MTNALRILLIYYTNITLVACAVTAHAESLQLKHGTPASLPPVLTSNAVNSTASTTVFALPENPRDSLATITRPAIDTPSKRAPYVCMANSTICYDYRKRHSVLPMTKSIMPDVPGLTKEGLAIKRDRVAFNYTF